MAALTAPFDVPQKPGEDIRLEIDNVKIYRGGAVAVLIGTGEALPLVPTVVGNLFIGVAEETVDNTADTANTYIRVARKGIFAFNQTGILAASVGQRAYFSDDNTITLTSGTTFAGIIVAIDQQNAVAWVDIGSAVCGANGIDVRSPFPIAASGAIDPHTAAHYLITKAGVAALTLAAPTAGTDDGKVIKFTSATANQHTVTATGLFLDGAGHVNVGTFPTTAGASFELTAYSAKWLVTNNANVVMS